MSFQGSGVCRSAPVCHNCRCVRACVHVRGTVIPEMSIPCALTESSAQLLNAYGRLALDAPTYARESLVARQLLLPAALHLLDFLRTAWERRQVGGWRGCDGRRGRGGTRSARIGVGGIGGAAAFRD